MFRKLLFYPLNYGAIDIQLLIFMNGKMQIKAKICLKRSLAQSL